MHWATYFAIDGYNKTELSSMNWIKIWLNQGTETGIVTQNM